jgi:hypothetical protein
MIALAWRTNHKDLALKGDILSKSEISAAPAEVVARFPILSETNATNTAKNPHNNFLFLKKLFPPIAEKHLLPLNRHGYPVAPVRRFLNYFLIKTSKYPCFELDFKTEIQLYPEQFQKTRLSSDNPADS